MAKLVLFDYKGTTNSHEKAKMIGRCKAMGNCVILRTGAGLDEVREDGFINVTELHGYIQKMAPNDKMYGWLQRAAKHGMVDDIKEVVFVDDEPWYIQPKVDALKHMGIEARVILPEEAEKEFV